MSKTGLHALLRPDDGTLVLIDHQVYRSSNLNSHEPTMVIHHVGGLAEAVKVFPEMQLPGTHAGARA